MKLSGYSYQKKIKAIGVCFILMIVVCYQLSIKKTIEEYQLYKAQTNNDLSQSPVINARSLETKSKFLDSKIEQYKLDTADQYKNLLGTIGQYCAEHNLIVKEYKPMGVHPVGNFNIFNRYVIMEGPFKDCLNLIYILETKSNIGRISSLNFKSIEDKKSGEIKLNCTIYVQNIL